MSSATERPVALVTGASRGIGAAVARDLASRNYHVIAAARSESDLATVCQQITDHGGSATARRLDVSDPDAIVAGFADLPRLDVLVANAGIGRFGMIDDLEPSDFDAVYAVNVRGAALCMREAVRLMRPCQAGRIIAIGSVVSVRGYPNQAAYTASKHALLGLTKSVAADVHSDGIRVSAVLPGGVDTDMVGDARPDLDRSQLMTPEDVAEAVAYLVTLSPRCAVDVIQLRRPGAAPF